MAYPFKSGGAVKRQLKIGRFRGVDFAASPLEMNPERSPDALNMIGDLNGFPVCRPGYETVLQAEGRINGIYRLQDETGQYVLVHHGTKLSLWENNNTLTQLYNGCSDDKSVCVQTDGKLYFFDGSKALIYGGFPVLDDNEQDTGEKVYEVRTLESEAYVPTTTIAKEADKKEGGRALEAVNLVSNKRKNSFLCKDTGKRILYLDTSPIVADSVKVKQMTENGDWIVLAPGKYTASANEGTVTLAAAQAAPVTGMDNYEVTFASEYNGWKQGYKTFTEQNEWPKEEELPIDTPDWWRKRGRSFRLKYVTAASAATIEIYYPGQKYLGDTKLTLAGLDQKVWRFQSTEVNDPQVSTSTERLTVRFRWYADGADIVVQMTNPYWNSSKEGPYSGTLDTVEFRYRKPDNKNLDLINHCTVVQKYGVGGNGDRLFVTGNPEKQNFDWWSHIFPDKANYFPDVNYAKIGDEDTAVMGYSWLSDGSLAIHKEGGGQDSSIYIRTGLLKEDGSAVFPVRQGAVGLGVVSKRALGYLNNEPLALSGDGVFAVAPVQNIAVNERYAQPRSYFVNPRLTKEAGLGSAEAAVYKGKYYLAVNSNVYVADGDQRAYTGKGDQYGYEWYFWQGLPVRVWWIKEKELYFGTEDGRICKLNNAFTDDRKPIACYWTTPVLDFGTGLYYKKVKNASAVSPPYRNCAIHIDYLEPGNSKCVKRADIQNNGFAAFPVNTVSNYKAKKVMYLQLRLRGNPGEAFGLYGIHILYTVSGKYKGAR